VSKKTDTQLHYITVNIIKGQDALEGFLVRNGIQNTQKFQVDITV
jgi:hypothetical protein